MDHWLNVWYISRTKLETIQECRSCHLIGWILQNFWETGVSCSLTFRLETKMLWCQTPLWKTKARINQDQDYQDQLNTGFLKLCAIFKVCGIESLKYVQEFFTPVCYCEDISTPLNMTRHNTKCDWLLYLSVMWPLGRALVIQSGQGSEDLATWDYILRG